MLRLLACRAAIQEQFFPNDIGCVPARGSEMALRHIFRGGVDGLASLQTYSYERDGNRRTEAGVWSDLDLAFYTGLLVVSKSPSRPKLCAAGSLAHVRSAIHISDSIASKLLRINVRLELETEPTNVAEIPG